MSKIQRSLCGLQRLLDDDYKELSDKCHRLELSHNRKRKLLDQFLILASKFDELCNSGLIIFKDVERDLISDWLMCFWYLHKRITQELYGLENYHLKVGKNERKVNKSC